MLENYILTYGMTNLSSQFGSTLQHKDGNGLSLYFFQLLCSLPSLKIYFLVYEELACQHNPTGHTTKYQTQNIKHNWMDLKKTWYSFFCFTKLVIMQKWCTTLEIVDLSTFQKTQSLMPLYFSHWPWGDVLKSDPFRQGMWLYIFMEDDMLT